MGIDGFTFVAQIFNFVLLVFLLKRFLYGPVLQVVERREKEIGDQVAEARRREEEAEARSRDLQAQRQMLEEKRGALIRQAEDAAEDRRRELTLEVREHVDELRAEWHEALRREKASFLDELGRRIGRQLFGIVRKVLHDLGDSELEGRIARTFAARLREIEPEVREGFVASAAGAGGRIVVRTAFPLADEPRQGVERILQQWTGPGVEIHFEQESALSLGIEARAGDRKIGWSVASYLDDLKRDVAGHLEAEAVEEEARAGEVE